MKKITAWALIALALAVAMSPVDAVAHGGHTAEHGTFLATLHHPGPGHVLLALAVLAVGGVAVAAVARSRA